MSKKPKSSPKDSSASCPHCEKKLPMKTKTVKSNGRRHELSVHFKEEKFNGAVEISVFPCHVTEITEIKEKYSR